MVCRFSAQMTTQRFIMKNVEMGDFRNRTGNHRDGFRPDFLYTIWYKGTEQGMKKSKLHIDAQYSF